MALSIAFSLRPEGFETAMRVRLQQYVLGQLAQSAELVRARVFLCANVLVFEVVWAHAEKGDGKYTPTYTSSLTHNYRASESEIG